jgi:hypothetical protein
LADVLADVVVPYFTKEINNIITFLILLADVLADLTETKNKKKDRSSPLALHDTLRPALCGSQGIMQRNIKSI